MKSGELLLGLLTAAFLWGGCTTALVREVRETPTGIEPGAAIAFVFSREFSLAGQPVQEKEIIGCISGAVRKAHPTLRIVPPEEFRRAVFFDLAPEAAPNNPEYFALLLDHPTFRERVAPLGIRYLISVVGGTEQTAEVGVIPLPPAALIGGAVWDRKSRLTASILDLKQARTSGEVRASASGSSWFVFVLPLPIMIGAPAFTESKACGDLGEAVAKFLADEGAPKSEEIKDDR
jgi:hypothetical protein